MILRKLDPAALEAGEERELSTYEALRRIRVAFGESTYPHPGLCELCAVKDAGLPVSDLRLGVLEVLHKAGADAKAHALIAGSGHLNAALLMFQRYLTPAPEAEDAGLISRHIGSLIEQVFGSFSLT